MIRPALRSDAEAIFGLVRQFATSYVPEREGFDRQFQALLESRDGLCLVAESTQGIAGYAVSFRLQVLYANGPITELQELMVRAEHRGQGIGQALVLAVIKTAWEDGSIEVTVPTRRAADFYKKLGFTETAAYLKLKHGQGLH